MSEREEFELLCYFAEHETPAKTPGKDALNIASVCAEVHRFFAPEPAQDAKDD